MIRNKLYRIYAIILFLNILILFNYSNAFAIDIKTSIDNIFNTADKLIITFEIKYDPIIEEIDYLKSDIKKDKYIEIKDFIIEYVNIEKNIEKKQRQFDIETDSQIEYNIKKTGKEVIEKISYTFQVFEIDDLYIKPLTLYYKLGNRQMNIKTPIIPILSKEITIITDENGNLLLKDIKGPFYEKKTNLIVIIGLTLSIILILIIILLLILNKRRQIKKTQSDYKEKTPSDIAIEELDKLSKLNLLEQGKIKEYYIKMSEIARKFLADKLNLSIMENPTIKIQEMLENKLFDDELTNYIVMFLRDCDFVKFANYKPSSDDAIKDLNKCYNIIYRFEPKGLVPV